MAEVSADEPKRRLVSEGPHALSSDDVCVALETRATGLTSTEARSRLARFGRNELPHAEPPGVLRIFFRQFLNPLIYILLVAAAISAVMRDWSDSGFILAVLVLNAIIGCVQEYSAEKSAQALRALAGSKAYVRRDGEDHEIDATELVPGDVVLLEAGSKVPADLRLISNGGVEVDESLLTGESLTVTKTPVAVLASDAALGDRVNMAFAATLVTRGRSHGVVVATGLGTQIGRIASSLTTSDAAKPPLLVRMERFTRKIAVGVVVAVVALGGVSVAQGSSVADVFMLAVALAVSAIPEGLPVALTVALSIGARRMARRRVIARRLVAVEALGSCTFIASDKTGTLTMNELTARKVLLPGGVSCDVTGQGVKPDGEVLAPDEERPLLARLCTASVLCNDGFLGLRDDVWVHHGDAVDVALLAMAAKAGVHRATVEVESPRVGEIPFEPEHRFAATLHRMDDVLHAAVKGAGERVLPMCSRMATSAGDVSVDASTLEEQANALAAAGFRVLAVAAGPVDLQGKELTDFAPDALTGLVFLGFVGMIDPLRPEAKASVHACQAAGIQVAMVTGDHPITALAIARELGFADRPEQVVTGPMLEKVVARGDQAVDALIRDARVFARVEPSQKLQIVESLIRLGHFVAVTGDGANDAPALRAAHIGVAMGERGTDVARESSELILTDDNFASIVAGVEEGRIAYGNVRKVIFLLVSSGAAEVLLFVLTTAAGLPVPLWPVQLLWLNLVTNGIQDVALAFEPGEGGELPRPPRAPREPIFNRLMLERTLVSAVVIAGVGFLVYRWMLDHGWPVHQAQNGVLLLLVLFENPSGQQSLRDRVALHLEPAPEPAAIRRNGRRAAHSHRGHLHPRPAGRAAPRARDIGAVVDFAIPRPQPFLGFGSAQGSDPTAHANGGQIVKIAMFDTHRYDRDSFEEANSHFGHAITFLEPRRTSATAALARSHEAVCSVVNDKLDERALEVLRDGGTRLVALRSAGYNHVDLSAAARLGMPVVRVSEYSPFAVAEHAVGLVLALNRKIHRAYARVREWNFSLDGLVGFDLYGKTAGILGTGRIGQVAARIFHGFGCRVLAFDLRPDAGLASNLGPTREHGSRSRPNGEPQENCGWSPRNAGSPLLLFGAKAPGLRPYGSAPACETNGAGRDDQVLSGRLESNAGRRRSFCCEAGLPRGREQELLDSNQGPGESRSWSKCSQAHGFGGDQPATEEHELFGEEGFASMSDQRARQTL